MHVTSKKGLTSLPLLATILFSMVGCQPGGQFIATADLNKIDSLQFEITTGYDFLVDDEHQFTINIIYKDAGDTLDSVPLVWQSNKSDVIQVDADGAALAVGIGTALVSVAIVCDPADMQTQYRATTVVRVSEESVALENVAFVEESILIETGEFHPLAVTLTPSNAHVEEIHYTSENTAVASIVNGNYVKGVSEGVASINVIATDRDGTSRHASINVEVEASEVVITPTGVVIDPATFSLNVAATKSLNLQINPAGASVDSITWSSDNENVATVSNAGLVTAIGVGSTTIRVDADGLLASASVTVKDTTGSGNNEHDAYYDGVQGLKGSALRSKLNAILNEAYRPSYSWDRYESADQAPDDPNAVFCLYSRLNYQKSNRDTGGNNPCWNREHTFPQAKIGGQADQDNHHIFACDKDLNGNRSNKIYGMVSGSSYLEDGYGRTSQCKSTGSVFEPGDSAKGEVARATLYLVCAYLSENITENFQSVQLCLDWNEQFGVTEREEIRNDRVQEKQLNRNPFIDHPEWAEMIFDNSYSGPGATLSL